MRTRAMRMPGTAGSPSSLHRLHAPQALAALRPRLEALELPVHAVRIAGVEENDEGHVVEHHRVHLVEDLLALRGIAPLARPLQVRDRIQVVPDLALRLLLVAEHAF